MATKKRVAYRGGGSKPVLAASGTMWSASYIEWTSTEDDINEGFGDEKLILQEKPGIRAKTLSKLVQKISGHYGLPKVEWYAQDTDLEHTDSFGILVCEFLVDDDNNEASKREIDEWKNGTKRLWNARIEVRVEEITVRVPTAEELATRLGIRNES